MQFWLLKRCKTFGGPGSAANAVGELTSLPQIPSWWGGGGLLCGSYASGFRCNSREICWN